MSDSESIDDDEDEIGGSALIRVLRRSLNMKRGRTEKALLRKSPDGWSERGQTLVDTFGDLITIHDRLTPLVDPLVDDEDAAPLVQRFQNLVDAIDTLTGSQVGNKPTPRDTAKGQVDALILQARQLESDLEDYNADNCTPQRGNVKALLTGGSEAAKRLLLAGNAPRLAGLIDKLPKNRDTAGALEEVEDMLLAGGGFIPGEVHEVLFRAKTECFEGSANRKIKGSTNPKLACLKDFPKDDYWRMLMDGNNQAKGDKHFYDRSKGYMASMMKGFSKIVDEVDRPMSVDFVKEMHGCSTYQVTGETGSNVIMENSFQEQGIKKSPNAWGVCYDCSEDGLEELKTMREEMNVLVPGYFKDDQEWEMKPKGKVAKKLPMYKAADSLAGLPPEEIAEKVEALMTATIDTYAEEIKAAKKVKDKKAREESTIGAVIDCCRRLGQVHAFKDANGRLNMFLLLNKMLLENGLPPTILPDQGLMIGQSREELIALIQDGQEKFGHLKD